MLAQSSEPEAHVKNARRTKNTKQDKMRVIYIYKYYKKVSLNIN